MKKVVSWTFGSVFRTFGRIIAYLIFGSILGFILSKTGVKLPDIFGLTYVNAATLSPTSFQYDARYSPLSCNLQLSNCIFESLGDWQGTVNGGTAIQQPSAVNGRSQQLTELSLKYYYSSNFVAGNTYNFKIRINTSNDVYSYIKNWYIRDIRAGNTSGSSNLTNDNISSSSITNITHDSSDSKVYYVTFSVTPINDVKYIWIYFSVKNGFKSDYFNVGNVNVRNSGVAYTEGIGAQIQQSTQAINNQTESIINNNNDNTESIINNNNQNTQNIIDNQNSNSQQQIDSQKVCNKKIINKNEIKEKGKYLYNDGRISSYSSSEDRGVTDYINIENVLSITTIQIPSDQGENNYCFYNSNKEYIICYQRIQYINTTIEVPSNAIFVRFTINENTNRPQFEYEQCKNGNQALQDTLNDDNVGDAESSASSWFSNFTTNTHGLTSIITAPLTAIQSLTSASCSPLVLPLPFVNKDLTLPCMRSIYVDNFGDFMNLYDVIVTGIISYWIMVRIFALVKDFKNPDHDEIEVVDL